MKTFKEFLNEDQGEDRYCNVVTVVFRNKPSARATRLLFESQLQLLEEGKTKDWGNGYSYRLDRRPDNQGGNQIHIYGPKGKAWAYRYNGARSEPQKYSLRTTNVVRDIVADVFGISPSSIDEAVILEVAEDALILQLGFE
jgi:hypothetical protein